MKRILVLQNQRIGDTLQTVPLLKGLRQKHTPCHITLVTNKMFSDLNLEKLVDQVEHFDQNGFFHAFQDPKSSILNKYARARSFLDRFRTQSFDLVVEVPADTNMHLLASALDDVGEIRGVVLSPMRGWHYSNPEVMLLYTIGLCREINRFNLVDLQNLLGGVQPQERCLFLPYHEASEKAVTRLLSEWGVNPNYDLLIALQPGASEERKRWGDTHFAGLARRLVERLKAKVILCGSDQEKASGERICREAGAPVITAMGRTAIAELAALLRLCRVLVTNDTGTMHLAASVGTPIVDISTGPVFFRETGPYAEGSIVIEGDIECSPCNFNAVCHHYSCRELISPGMVFKIVENILHKRSVDALEESRFRGTKIHRAVFNDVGRLEFLPVFRYPISHYQLLGFFYAHTWELFYGLRDRSRTVTELLDEITRLHDVENSWSAIREDLSLVIEDLGQMETEMRMAEQRLTILYKDGRSWITQEHWMKECDEVQKIYEQILLFGRSRPSILHFTAYLEMAVSSQAGIEPLDAVRKIAEAFKFVRDQSSFLKEQLEEAMRLLNGKYPAMRLQVLSV